MKFSEVLEALRNGERLTNSTLSNDDSFIVRQVPQVVPKEVVPKMTSLPASAKEHMNGSEIRFSDQVLLVWWSSMQEQYIATSWNPTCRDLFREDWTIV